MDPASLLMAATAAFNGVKKAVEMGREVQDVFKQLSKWADAADQLYGIIATETNKSPGIFESLNFSKSATAEALDLSAAKLRLQQMEDEIKLMFYYGELQALGQKGYADFIKDRREIKEKRRKLIELQVKKRKKFIENAWYASLLCIAIAAGVYFSILFYEFGQANGKW
jgi:hypothetical protein